MFDVGAVKKSFGDAASDYDAQAILQREVRAHCITLASRLWKRNDLILDLGCGTGAFHEESQKFGWRVTGIDLAPGMCAQAKGTVINADVAALPVADQSFDGVFSSLMLQWVDDIRKTFSEIARILKPGGQAVIATLTEGTLDELRHSFLAVDTLPHVSHFAPPHALLEDSRNAGLSLVQLRQSRVVEYYSDTVALMRALQVIGARNADANRKRGLMTPRQCAKVEQAYRAQYENARGLPASWQILYMVLQKS